MFVRLHHPQLLPSHYLALREMTREKQIQLCGTGRSGALQRNRTSAPALVTDRVAPGVVYTSFHHPMTQANVVTTDYFDWATICPDYKVTAVQVSTSNGPSHWQEE